MHAKSMQAEMMVIRAVLHVINPSNSFHPKKNTALRIYKLKILFARIHYNF